MLLKTYAEAEKALTDAEADVAADHGADFIDECWGDLVRAVADQCIPSVRRELCQTKLGFQL